MNLRILLGAGTAAFLLSSAAYAQQPDAPPPPTAGNIPPAANQTMPPIDEPFGGNVNQSEGQPAPAPTSAVTPSDATPEDNPSADTPTEGTSAPPIPTTGPDAVPERAEGVTEASSVPDDQQRPGCKPADGPSVSETEPAEGGSSGTSPGGSGSSGWTGGLGGSDIGTSQSEPLPGSPNEAQHPEVASGLDPISGETAVTGPASPPPPAPEPAEDRTAAAQPARLGETTPGADSSVPPATASANLQAPSVSNATGDPC